MGLVQASGILALPLVQLKRLIAASATFRQLVGASDEASALERIRIAPADDVRNNETRQLLTPRPRAIVAGHGFKRKKTGTSTWSSIGTMEFWLEVPVPADRLGALEDEVLGLLVTAGAILQEMETAAATPRTDSQGWYLNMTGHDEETLIVDLVNDDAGVVQDDDEQTIGEPELFMSIGAQIEWSG